jgi:sugar/nucleoside kinase (ribokinase family)
MASPRCLDLVCFSYLADTQILRVTAYPPPNHGAIVREARPSIAADGPITALTAASLGLRAGLVANQVGTDPAGTRLVALLTDAGIHNNIQSRPDLDTPRLTVITDDTDTRTWFAYLADLHEQLHTLDLSLLTRTRLAYIDCYRAITTAATRAIRTVTDTPLMLNLGGDPVDDRLVTATVGRPIAAVQTSVDESTASDAENLASAIYQRLHPDAAIVTLGSLGALARTAAGIHHCPADTVMSAITHGAGAAFSAGYAHATLNGADITDALLAGCHAGTTHCATPPHLAARTPNLLVDSRELEGTHDAHKPRQRAIP